MLSYALFCQRYLKHSFSSPEKKIKFIQTLKMAKQYYLLFGSEISRPLPAYWRKTFHLQCIADFLL